MPPLPRALSLEILGSSATHDAMCSEHPNLDFMVCLIFSCLSALGSIFIITSWLILPTTIRYKKLRVLLFYLSVMDLTVSLSYIASPWIVSMDGTTATVERPTLCTWQGLISTYASMSSFITTALIGIYLLQAVSISTHLTSQDRFLHRHSAAIFLTTCVLLPAVLCAIVYANDMFGYSDDFGEQWCWIKQDSADPPSDSARTVMHIGMFGGRG